jgi:hypothetical protein
MARTNLREGDRVNEPELDIEPVLEYSPLEPFSAFRYLTRLATCTDAWEAARRKEWSLDLASASMAVRTLVEVADIPGPAVAVLGAGANYFMVGLISQIFWTALLDFDPNFVRLCAGKTFGTEYGAALTNLVRARRTLFSTFRALGIPRATTANLNYVHQSLTADEAFRVARAPF